MTTRAPGQMTWKPPGFIDAVLHLRLREVDPWQPYTAFPQYSMPDPPGFSAGYATFLALLKQNWQTL
jgi:hypothetical protein